MSSNCPKSMKFDNGSEYHQLNYLGTSRKGCETFKAQSADGKDVFITTWKFHLESIRRKCPISCTEIFIEPKCRDHTDDIVETFKTRAKFIIENVKHTNLVRYVDVNCEISDENLVVNLVQEYIEGVSVKSMSEQGILPSLAPIAEWLLKAVSYLHSINPKINHGYINNGSIFLGKSAVYRVADYHLIPYLMYLKGTHTFVHAMADAHALGNLVDTNHKIVNRCARDFIKKCQSEPLCDLLKHTFLSNVHTGDANTIYDGPLLNHFEINGKLGKGSYGSVLKAKNLTNQESYAFKLIELPSGSKGKYEKVKREVELISKLKHENVVEYINSWEQNVNAAELKKFEITLGESSAASYDSAASSNSGQQFFDVIIIQMELCAMDLTSAMKECYKQDEPIPRQWFEDMACGLLYLHANKICHRDINPRNILLDFCGRMKIGDFGLATTMDLIMKQRNRDIPIGNSSNERSSQTGHVGTSYYIAPELSEQASNATYGTDADIYSLGMVFFEMVHPPFKTGSERHKVLTDAKNNVFPDFIGNSDDNLFKLIKKMLSHDPENRPKADDIVCEFTVACLKDEGFEDVSYMKSLGIAENTNRQQGGNNYPQSESEYEFDGNESAISFPN